MIAGPRWSLFSMTVFVAVVAAACRWPLAATLLALVFGGPILGGWLGSSRGGDGTFAGAVVGGIVWHAALVVVPVLLFAVFPPARRASDVVVLVPVLVSPVAPGASVGYWLYLAGVTAVHACAGMVFGAAVGCVMLAVIERRGR